MILGGASRIDLVRQFARLTPATIINNRYPSLALLKKKHGQEKVEGVLSILLVEASQAFETQFDKETALAVSAEVASTFYYYSLEDCYYVLQQLKKSKQYGKLTENKVLAAFAEYEKQRLKDAEEMNYNNHLAEKENPDTLDREVKPLKDVQWKAFTKKQSEKL